MLVLHIVHLTVPGGDVSPNDKVDSWFKMRTGM